MFVSVRHRLLNSYILVGVLLLPAAAAIFCAVVLGICSMEEKPAAVAVTASDLCLSCFELAPSKGVIKPAAGLPAPHVAGAQAWLPSISELPETPDVSFFRSGLSLNESPPPDRLLLSILRI